MPRSDKSTPEAPRRPVLGGSAAGFSTLAVVVVAVVMFALGSGATVAFTNLNRSALPTPVATQPSAAAASPAAKPAATAPAAGAATPRPTVAPINAAELVGPSPRALGPADAPVTLVLFTDFQCPYCRRYHQDILPQILKAYEGKVRFVFRDLPLTQLHAQALRAAEAARAAGEQGKFWEYADLIFKEEGELSDAKFVEMAGSLNLDKGAFEAALASGKHKAAVQRDMEDAQRFGVTGTPTTFVNGRAIPGAQPFQAYKALIDSLLAAPAK